MELFHPPPVIDILANLSARQIEPVWIYKDIVIDTDYRIVKEL